LAICAVAGSLGIAGVAHAADADDEIVVTGTLIRGVAPAGAQQFTVSSDEITAKSVTSTAQLMASIPQMASFGNLQTVNSGGTQLTVSRTNLRNLPQSIGGSSPTLVLMDGHRIVGMGVRQSYPDPDVIPPMVIGGVDVLTDGGSATYGSDAMGGVINFNTRKKVEGINLAVRQSFGSDYKATDVNFSAGTSWSNGSAFVAYNYSRHDAVYGRSRDAVKSIDWATGLPSSKNCSPANATVAGATYAVTNGSALSLSNANLCDRSDVTDFYPREDRHSVMAGVNLEVSDSLEFEVKGWYSQRKNLNDSGPLQGNATVASTNPNYISIGGGSTASQAVAFDFAPVGGIERNRTNLWAMGITPTVTWKIGGDWRMKAFFNYGESKTTAVNPTTNSTNLNAAVAAGTINPYNVSRSNAAALASVLDWQSYGIGRSKLSNAKATFDGPLFALPGGEVRAAVGGEFIHESFAGIVATDTAANARLAPLKSASRDVTAAFAELSIPLVGPDMNWPIHSIDLSASVRYDHYNDFGNNWAPNVGLSIKPVDWINLRGRWNKSFQAPSVVNLSQAGAPLVGNNPGFIVNFAPLLRNTLPGAPAFNGGPIISVQGSVSPLQPQRARDYNLGFDISPPFLEGFAAHVTYFNIDYRGTIGQPPLGFGTFYGVPAFQNLYIMLPTTAQLQQFLTDRGVSASVVTQTLASVAAQGGTAYVVADVRQRNLGITKINGWDFSFDFKHDTSFGSVYARYSSTLLHSSLTANDGTNYLPDQAGLDGSAYNHVATLGATVGENFRGQVTWNHRAGYRLSTPAALNQTTVGTFDTFDLYLQYDLQQNALPPITLSLGVTNMFDKDPPVYRGTLSGSPSGTANGSALGRVFQIGAGVKF